MAVLLGLPNEALLRIFHYLPKSVKHPKPQADLLNLSLTCKRLAPLAREVLFTAPILHPCKIYIFLVTLLKYPDLQSKMQSLTVDASKIHGSWVVSDPGWLSPAPNAEIVRRCYGILHNLDLDEKVKQEYIQVLQRKSGWFGNIISLILILLPNLSSLYLGGTQLSDDTFLQSVSDQDLYPYQKISRLNRIRVSPQLSAKLTFLELPIGLRLCGEAKGSVPKLFPELQHLILPYNAIVGIPATDIIPPELETLVLTRCTEHADDWLNQVAPAEGAPFPNLRSLSVYWRPCPRNLSLSLYEHMMRLDITFYGYLVEEGDRYSADYEYVVQKGNGTVTELNHPWLYTTAELDAFNEMRSEERNWEEYEEWDEEAW